MGRLYVILAVIGWLWLVVFFAALIWRMHRMKRVSRRGFEVIESHEKQL